MFLWEDLTPAEQREAREWWEAYIPAHTPGCGFDFQILQERVQDLIGGPQALHDNLSPWPMPPEELTAELEVPPECRVLIRSSGHYTPELELALKRNLPEDVEVAPQHTRFRGQSVFVSLSDARVPP